MNAPAGRLRDAHLHLHEYGAALSAVDLSSCDSVDACLERIAEAARSDSDSAAHRAHQAHHRATDFGRPRAKSVCSGDDPTAHRDELDGEGDRSSEGRATGWVVGVRARVEGWRERRWPTVAELHEAAGGRPCIVKSFDIHALAASDGALRAAGLDPEAPADLAIESGEIERDDRGRPTGLMLERAAQFILDAMPEPARAQRTAHIRHAADDLARRGFVEVHDMLSPPWLAEILAELDDRGELPLRVLLHPVVTDLDEMLRRRGEYERDAVRLGGVKIFTDGTLNSRTAWMLEPYADPRPGSPRGVRMVSDEQIIATSGWHGSSSRAGLRRTARRRTSAPHGSESRATLAGMAGDAQFIEALRRAEAAGLPLAAHAIGDAAVRRCLDLIEAHATRGGHRIEHCEFIDARDVPRFAALDVIASVQPCHLQPDIEALRRLTPHRLDRVLPLRELIDAARRAGRDPAELVWFGSDAPVVDPDPEDNAQAAVHRRRAGMRDAEAIAPEQAITEDEAAALMRAANESETT